jgi:hypothetical protein
MMEAVAIVRAEMKRKPQVEFKFSPTGNDKLSDRASKT